MMANGSLPDTSHHDVVSPRATHAAPSSANVGLSVNKLSRFISTPCVMLKGRPVLAMMNGLSDTCHGMFMLPPIVKLCRMSNAERPYSSDISYEYAGKLPDPSVSPL